MHDSVMAFLVRNIEPSWVRAGLVLEVGSYNVNGSARTVIEPMEPACYVGIDMREGPGVDYACKFSNTFCINDLRAHFRSAFLFDLVICTEVLEHVEEWRSFVNNLKRVLNPGGILVLTTRAAGFPLHEYPGDFWRFTKDQLRDAFLDMNELVLEDDPQAPGVFGIWQNYIGLADLSKIEPISMNEARQACSDSN